MSKAKSKKPRTSVIDNISPGFTERSDRGKASNRRGKVFERDVANKLKAIFPRAARSYGQSREGHETPDVVGTPLWIECAKGSTNAIHDKLRQGLEASKLSQSDAYAGAPVAVFSKHDRAGLEMVTMRSDHFLALMKKLYAK